MRFVLVLFLGIGFSFAQNNSRQSTVKERFAVPLGFKRVKADSGSFAHYLRKLPLKPKGSKVYYYDGRVKQKPVHAAVIDLSVGNKDLQQCADAIIRLYADYMLSVGREDEIVFTITNGFKVPYPKWKKGWRVKVDANNHAKWVKTNSPFVSNSTYKAYLEFIFTYAGTWSLEREMHTISNLKIGDVLIQGGFPGHSMIVVDKAKNKKGPEEIYLLAQSMMPAQDMHILINPLNDFLSPWYVYDGSAKIITPEWRFGKENWKRFPMIMQQ